MNLAADLAKSSAKAASSSDTAPTPQFPHAIQQLIDDLPEEIALLDEDFRMIAANRTWSEVCERSGNRDALPGCNYRDVCARKAAEGYRPAQLATAAFEEFASGARDFWQMTYNGGVRWEGRDYQFSIHRIGTAGETAIMVTRLDLTELVELRRLKSDYSSSLLESQTVERQRVARELHDSTSQLLVAMGLVIGRLKMQSPDKATSRLVEELQDLLSEAHQEIRLISYLAHPPAIEKMGLTAALAALVDGYARRTGLKASFEVFGDDVHLSVSEQSALYRIAQEALSNVHRHAQAKRVRVTIFFRHSAAHIIVADNGVGVGRKTLAGRGPAGVGLASMRERLAELHGRLTIRRLSPGTAIVASLKAGRSDLVPPAD